MDRRVPASRARGSDGGAQGVRRIARGRGTRLRGVRGCGLLGVEAMRFASAASRLPTLTASTSLVGMRRWSLRLRAEAAR